ncbi:MAG: hypothetical protein NZM12_09635, partial [Steroidobacteraceae bacterium]|nr:hypothetical protein [Steroidobacteraceae bacterium]
MYDDNEESMIFRAPSLGWLGDAGDGGGGDGGGGDGAAGDGAASDGAASDGAADAADSASDSSDSSDSSDASGSSDTADASAVASDSDSAGAPDHSPPGHYDDPFTFSISRLNELSATSREAFLTLFEAAREQEGFDESLFSVSYSDIAPTAFHPVRHYYLYPSLPYTREQLLSRYYDPLRGRVPGLISPDAFALAVFERRYPAGYGEFDNWNAVLLDILQEYLNQDALVRLRGSTVDLYQTEEGRAFLQAGHNAAIARWQRDQAEDSWDFGPVSLLVPFALTAFGIPTMPSIGSFASWIFGPAEGAVMLSQFEDFGGGLFEDFGGGLFDYAGIDFAELMPVWPDYAGTDFTEFLPVGDWYPGVDFTEAMPVGDWYPGVDFTEAMRTGDWY